MYLKSYFTSDIQTSDCFICWTYNNMYNVNEVQTQAITLMQ